MTHQKRRELNNLKSKKVSHNREEKILLKVSVYVIGPKNIINKNKKI